MAKIVFIMDTEEGHVIPSFGLANALRKKDHDICYLGIIDSKQLIIEQGFSFYPIMENIYPSGFRKRSNLPVHQIDSHQDNSNMMLRTLHINELTRGAYDSFLDKLQADLYIVSVFLHLDILVLYYKYNIQPVILTPFLRKPGKTLASECLDIISNVPESTALLIESIKGRNMAITSLQQVVQPMDTFCELVVCPRELDIDQQPVASNTNYIGPSIRSETATADIHVRYNVPVHKKIIYASLGSQAKRHGNVCDIFFRKVMSVMQQQELQDLHLILCAGPEYELQKLTPASDNVTVVGWAPQIDIVKTAAVAIIHGGLGSIKECIYYGVPMIIFPLGYDQPLNAKRVKHHHLGVVDNIKTVAESILKLHILHVLNSPEIKTAVKDMQQVFREKEAAQAGVTIVENLLKTR